MKIQRRVEQRQLAAIHNAEVASSTLAPATIPEDNAPVSDVIPEESPGEKWWREFQANLNK